MELGLEGGSKDTPIVLPVGVQVNWGTFSIGLVATAQAWWVKFNGKSTKRVVAATGNFFKSRRMGLSSWGSLQENCRDLLVGL